MRERQMGQGSSRERRRPAHSMHTHTWPQGRRAAARSRSIHTQHRRDDSFCASAPTAVADELEDEDEAAGAPEGWSFVGVEAVPSVLMFWEDAAVGETATASGGSSGARRRGSNMEGAVMPNVKATLRRGSLRDRRSVSIAANFRSVIWCGASRSGSDRELRRNSTLPAASRNSRTKQ